MATKNAPEDVVRLGRELRERGYQVYAHPLFGGVTKGAHDPKGAHYSNGGEAIDVGRDKGGPMSAHEQLHLDRLAVELDARGFAPIWWRGPNDHQDHLHAATSKWRGAPGYRYAAAGSRQTYKLQIDGKWGPATWAGLAWALNRPAPTRAGWNVTGDVVRPLQRLIHTETRSERLTVDGKLGPATWTALADLLGVERRTKQPTADYSAVTAILQLNIMALGRVVHSWR